MVLLVDAKCKVTGTGFKVYRDMRGALRAKSAEVLSKFEDGTERIFEVTTSKSEGIGIATHASVSLLEPRKADECYTVKTHKLFEDYSKRIYSEPCQRVTPKVIELAHRKALESVYAQVKEDAKKHYNIA